jgi:hypothetical protein
MTISLRTLLLVALAAALALIGWLAFVRSGDAAPAVATPIAHDPRPRPPAPARVTPEVPLGSVDGASPGTSLTLLSLRRTGPKVVTARLRISFVSQDPDRSAWLPPLIAGGLSAADMRLVDEVNGREHFVLRNADGECLCSGPFEVIGSGASSVISAKFPAPPPEVTHASVETPGFPSFDQVPLS